MIPFNIVVASIIAFVGGVVTGLCIYSDFIDVGGSDDEHA